MQNEDYSPDEMDIDSLAVPVQDFSYGGPVESSGERQESMDDFEDQFELYRMAKGGLAEANIYNLSDEEDEAINTDPVGASQKLLAGLTGEQAASPTARSIKAPARKPSGGAESPKEMSLVAESLTTAKDLVPKLKDKGSARQQMEELARVYQLKIRAAQDKSKGLAADTLGAPTLEQPTLTKNTLAKKRFAKGGEAMAEPTLIESSPATRTFLNVLGGRREPLTEKDFTPSEHAAMLEVIRTSEARGKSPKGRVDYGDYPSAENAGPGYKDIRNTLGGFGYQRDPEGGVTISDKYDFHGPRVAEYEKMGGIEKAASTAKNALLEFLKQGGPRDLAGEIGRAYIGTKGPDIKIRIPPPPVKRAKGSPEEGELTQEEIDAASKPAFITPKSGKGRKEGPISEALRSGEAYVSMAKGLTEMPYNLAGAPMDLTMLARQALTGQAPAGQVGTSDYIKRKATELGIRPAPPADPTQKGFYTAGDLLSNLVNPASLPRKVGPAIEKGVKAGATEVGRQLDRAVMDSAGPLAGVVPDAARPMYISRAPGGYFPTSRANEGGILSELDKAFDPVLKEAKLIEDPEKRQALSTLFNQKAKDFYTKQAGSIQDPLRNDILSGALKFPDEAPMADVFPRTLQKSAAQGDLQALRLLEKNYDEMLGIKSVVPRRAGTPVITGVVESQIMSNIRDNLDKIPDAQLVAYSGRKPGTSPTAVADIAAEIRQKVKDNPTLFSTVLEPRIARTIFATTRTSSDVDMARYPSLYGTTATEAMVRDPSVPAPVMYSDPLPPNYFLPDLETAIEKGQPVQDIITSSIKPLGMTVEKLYDQARQMSAEELNRMGFVDFLKKAYANTQQLDEYASALPKVKKLIEAGKPPPADIMTYGVQDFLPTADEFRWVKVTKPDAVRAIATGMDNSVGSYATSKTYGSLGKGRSALNSGEAEVYALYDKNNVPHVTMEYLTNKAGVPEAKKNTIAQLTGNGPLTANATPEKYAPQIVDLLNNIRPTSIPLSIKQLLEKTGQREFLTDEAMAPLYFGVPVEALVAPNQMGLLQRLGLR